MLAWIDLDENWKKFDNQKAEKKDCFNNLSLIHKVQCRILLIHGTND